MPPNLTRDRAPGELALAVLARVLFEEPVELSQVRPEVPAPLSMLVRCMLAKRPELRPANGQGVLAALAAITSVATLPAAAQERLSGDELRRLFVVMAWAPRPVGDDRSALQALAATHEARIEQLMDGSVVATVSAEGSATDGAARAARCALALRRLMPGAAVSLATGRGLVNRRLPIGEVIDRAVTMIRTASQNHQAAGNPPIRLDDTIAGLLGQRFVVESDGERLLLQGERAMETPRTLLGRPSPCVGRDRELALLHGSFAACANDAQARAVIVTGPPGTGKTRLRHEFLGQLGASGQPVHIFVGAAEKLAAGSPFFLAGQLLRQAAGVHGGEGLDLRRRRLRTRVARHVPSGEVERVASFLGELAGVPFPDEGNMPLAAARRDPELMGDQTRSAWEALLRAECRAHPVVLVLEDLHWGDLPTVAHVDWALARLEDERLLVLALARPEVHQSFPALWKHRRCEEMPLGQLPRRACERLVQHMLGQDTPPHTTERVVNLAGGNAFYLEELIRAVAEGRSQLPESVLAMAQSRYEALAAQARQLLRAAAILGEVFWRGAVFFLVPHLGGAEGDRWLSWLVERELLERRPQCRFQGETEYAFRHAFLREAAYAALIDEDRARGHRLAADWLEQSGESDPMTLAEHLDRAGEPRRAVGWYRLGAEHALEGGDFVAAQGRVKRALACGPSADDRVALLLVDLEALKWQGHHGAVIERAEALAAEVPRGSPAWLRAVSDLSATVAHLPQLERDLTDLPVEASATSAFIICAARVLTRSYVRRLQDDVAPLREKVERLAAGFGLDPILEGWLNQARAFHAGAWGRVDDVLHLFSQARACFLAGGDRRNAFAQLVDRGYALLEVGCHQEAQELMAGALEEMADLGLSRLLPQAQVVLATAQLRLGDHRQAIATAEQAAQAFAREGRPHFNHVRSLQVLANAHRLSGNLAEAERVARQALATADRTGTRLFDPRPALAQVLLATGRADEALALVSEPIPRVVFSDSEGGPVAQRLVRAEALRALGQNEAARLAIHEARDFVSNIAGGIADESLRRSFLQRVPDVARILELGRRLDRYEPRIPAGPSKRGPAAVLGTTPARTVGAAEPPRRAGRSA